MAEESRPGDEAHAFGADPPAVYAFVARFLGSLRESDVEHVVVSPGSRSTPLAVVAKRLSGLRTWVELDERAAGYFALGLAKASGRPALLVCTSGTAAANYLPAVVEAYYARVPLLVATADRPPELRDWGAGQTIEQPGLYGRYARWCVEVAVPGGGGSPIEADPALAAESSASPPRLVADDALRYAEQLAVRATETACGQPAGPVHLNWPLREPLAPVAGQLDLALAYSEGDRPPPRYSRGVVRAERGDVRELVALARSTERGVVCCGPMEPDAALRESIQAFADASGWPILADPASNLRSEVDPGRAPVLDLADVLTRSPAFRERMRPDVVVRIGDTPVSKAQRTWLEQVEPEAVLWLDEGRQWGEPSHRATRVIRGGAASLLAETAEDLTELATGRSRRDSDWCRELENLNAVARKALDDAIDGASMRSDPPLERAGDHPRATATDGSGSIASGLAVAGSLARAIPADGQLFVSNSMSIRLLDLTLANRSEALRVFCNRGASGIDGVTSTALGVAAATARPTLLLTGDLAFLHDLGGLLITRRESIPLTIVVLDDNGGGIFSFLPIAAQAEDVSFRTLFHTPHDVDLAHAARLVGAEYLRFDARSDRRQGVVPSANGTIDPAADGASSDGSPSGLADAIGRALGHDGVSIIHVLLDPEANANRFRAVLTRACAAVDAGASR